MRRSLLRLGATSALRARPASVHHVALALAPRTRSALAPARAFSGSTSLRITYLKPFLLADIGEGITECEIVKWLVAPNQMVDEFDPIVEVMSDKATVEITTPFAGRIVNLAGAVGDVVKVGGQLCQVEMDDDAETTTAPPPEFELPPYPLLAPTPVDLPASLPGVVLAAATTVRNLLVHATPATRRMAKEARIHLGDVLGTGKDGRVTKGDVLAFVASSSTSTSSPVAQSESLAAPAAAVIPSETTSSPLASTTGIALSPLRKAMFRAMTSTLQIPHFAYSETIDVTLLERLRVSLNGAVPLHYRQTLSPALERELARNVEWGGPARVAVDERYDRMTLLPLLVKALSAAMTTNRLFLSTLAPSHDELLPRASHDISLALSAPDGGLFTPLLSGVESASHWMLASRIAHLQSLSLASSPPKFPPAYRGAGTVTLSNVGVIGGTTTHPLIPPTGQLAIGALGRTRVVPVYAARSLEAARQAAVTGLDAGDLVVEPRLLMDVTFCGDHRVVEGVELARLVETWKRLIEAPGRI